jgi:outer membrane protein with beta-barrel domain
MKRVMGVVAVALLLGATTSAAQGVRVGLGAGLLLPMGDYKTADKTGWIAGVDVTDWLAGGAIGIRVEGSYSQTSHKAGISGNSKIIGGMADVVYAFGTSAASMRPYVLGGIGFYNVKFTGTGSSVSESKVGFGGGAGVAFKLGTGGSRVFVEGKYVSVSTTGSSTTFLPVRAGIRFALK